MTVSTSPRTIHDFGGFPRELYQVQYPAPGDPELGEACTGIATALPVDAGSILGAWITARGRCSATSIRMPTFQSFSSASTRPDRLTFHFEVGQKLAPLRDEGILIVGSGNLVHNLHAYAWGRHAPDPYDWAVRFEERAKELMLARRELATDRIRKSRNGRATLDPDPGSLPAAVVCARCAPVGRCHHIPR